MRILYHVAEIHELRGTYPDLITAQMREDAALCNTISVFWDLAEKHLNALQLPSKNLVIFPEGCAVYSTPLSVLQALVRRAGEGERLYRIILQLIENGARLEATENRKLSALHARLIKLWLSSQGEVWKKILYRMCKFAMAMRDWYVASRINRTLGDEEVGLLFLGAAHRDFHQHLAPDIELRRVLDSSAVFQEAAYLANATSSPYVQALLSYLRPRAQK